MSARVQPGLRRGVSLQPFFYASILIHLALLLAGRHLIRPGGWGAGRLALEPGPGFERAWPGVAGTPVGMRLGLVELALEPRILIVPAPRSGAQPKTEPVPTPPEPVPAADPALPVAEAPIPEPAGGVAGDPAGSSELTGASGDSSGTGRGGGGDGEGGGGDGSGGGGGPGGEDFVQGRDTLPVIQSMTLPDYPEGAKGRSRVPVVLRVHVTADGQVDDVQVAEASGCGSCEQAAIASAWKLRFAPGTRAGRPVPMWVRYPVTFGRK